MPNVSADQIMRDNFGMLKKLKLHFAIDENRELLHLLAKADVAYSQAKINGNSLRYYQAGCNLTTPEMFRRKYCNGYKLETYNSHIVMFSVNGNIMPDNRTFMKYRQRVAIPFGAEFQWMECQNVRYTSLPITADLEKIIIDRTDIELPRGTFTISAIVPNEFVLTEDSMDQMRYLQNSIDPHLAAIKTAMNNPNINLYSNKDSASHLFKATTTFLTDLKLINNPKKELTREIRAALIKVLLNGDNLVATLNNRSISSNMKFELVESDTDSAPVLGMFEHEGAYWSDEIEFNSGLKHWTGDLPSYIERQKGLNRIDYLLNRVSFDERIYELTWQEVNNIENMEWPNITLAMTPEEDALWSEDPYGEYAKRLEAKAISRWQEFHPDHPSVKNRL